MSTSKRIACSTIVAALVATAAPTNASAESAAVSEQAHPAHDVHVAIAPHFGILVPQIFSDLGSFPVFGLELGYLLPFDVGSMVRPLQLNFDVMFTAPTASGVEDGPALGDASGDGEQFNWQLRERVLVLEFNGMWRFMPPADGFSVYATAGPRVYLMESVMNATSESGADFGENRETKTQVGLMLGGGAEYAVGPGAIFGALEFGWSDMNQRITGDSNTGALVVDLGYRFLF